ncbi:MAG: SHOCT domain-containing protein [Pseudomonadales bacterium]|nr:SHOCT domain-containing protein [Pseudomonadales bacterium]
MMDDENWTGWLAINLLLWLLLLIVLIVTNVRLSLQDKSEGIPAKKILDKRYANGEICKEEYEEILKDLGY